MADAIIIAEIHMIPLNAIATVALFYMKMNGIVFQVDAGMKSLNHRVKLKVQIIQRTIPKIRIVFGILRPFMVIIVTWYSRNLTLSMIMTVKMIMCQFT